MGNNKAESYDNQWGAYSIPRRIEGGEWTALLELESDMGLLLGLLADPRQVWWCWGARSCADSLVWELRRRFNLPSFAYGDGSGDALERLRLTLAKLPSSARPGDDIDQAIAILERYWPTMDYDPPF